MVLGIVLAVLSAGVLVWILIRMLKQDKNAALTAEEYLRNQTAESPIPVVRKDEDTDELRNAEEQSVAPFQKMVSSFVSSDRDSNSEPVELKSLQLYNREGGFYILAVDPKISETAKLKVFANRMGANLTECQSGPACLEECSKNMYDLIIIAATMPWMDGAQTLHNLQKSENSKCKDAKVYVLVEENKNHPDSYYYDEGFDGIIRKPVEEVVMEDTVMELAPKRMLTQAQYIYEDIRNMAGHARTLQESHIHFSAALSHNANDLTILKKAAERFCSLYNEQSEDMADALYSANASVYMEMARTLRDLSANLGAAHLSDVFDDHVNMAKDESLEVAESKWIALRGEWAEVVSGLADWLGMKDIDVSSSEIISPQSNSITLSKNDIRERVQEILSYVEKEEQDIALEKLNKIGEYVLDEDVRLKFNQTAKAFEKGSINTAVNILKTF